jgi:hypothetical protein
MAFEQERKFVAEKDAKLVSYQDNELLFRRTLIRNWPAEKDKYIEDALTYLYSYGSEQPPVASNPTPAEQQWIDNPLADRLEYEGRWRVVSNEKTSRDNEAQWPGLTGIIQTLRFGFAEALSWDEARVINNELLPGNASTVDGVSDSTSDDPSDILIVEWVNLDPEHTRAMAVGTDTSTILAPNEITSDMVIRGVDYNDDGATYHKVAVTVMESELQDGSGRIRAVFAQPQYTLNAYESVVSYGGNERQSIVHYLWNVPRDLAQTVINDWRDTRRSATASTNADNTVNIVLREFDPGDDPIQILEHRTLDSCSRIEDTSFYWGVEDPDGAEYDIAGSHDTGVTYRKQVSFNKSEGTFDVVITKVSSVPRNSYADKLVRRSFLEEREETAKFGQDSLPDDPQDPPIIGKVEQLSIRVNDDCSIDSTLVKITSTENAEIVSWNGEYGTHYEGVYQNWDEGSQAMVDAFLTDTAITETSYSISVTFTRNEDGTYNGRIAASPKSFTISGGGNDIVYTGFTYWNAKIETIGVKDENDDEIVRYYVPEYYNWTVEYYDIDSFSEGTVHGKITGRGMNARVTTVGNFYRLEMQIGQVLESSPGIIADATVGINAGGAPSGISPYNRQGQ